VVEVPEITSKQEWHLVLEAARRKTADLGASQFPWTVVSAIEGRLGLLGAVADSGRAPSLHEREHGMTLGVIAVRSLYGVAPELCRLLLQLASGFDHWTQLPDA